MQSMKLIGSGLPRRLSDKIHTVVGAQKPAHPYSFPPSFFAKRMPLVRRAEFQIEGGHLTTKKVIVQSMKLNTHIYHVLYIGYTFISYFDGPLVFVLFSGASSRAK